MDSSHQTAAQPTAPDRCEFSPRLSAYHDGELDPQSAAQVEKHVSSCEECRAELQEIRELSALAGALGREGISPFGMRRIHQAIDDAQPAFSVLRIAGILTGLAASALIIGSAWLWESPAPQNGRPNVKFVIIDRNDRAMEIALTLDPTPLPQWPLEVRDPTMLAQMQFSNDMLDGLSGR